MPFFYGNPVVLFWKSMLLMKKRYIAKERKMKINWAYLRKG